MEAKRFLQRHALLAKLAVDELRQAVDEGDDTWACLAMTECLVDHMPELRRLLKRRGFYLDAIEDAAIVWACAYIDERTEASKPEVMKRIFFPSESEGQ